MNEPCALGETEGQPVSQSAAEASKRVSYCEAHGCYVLLAMILLLDSAVDETPPPKRPKHPPAIAIVQCPKCGFKEAVVIVARLDDKGCFCPQCEHVWVARVQQ